MKIENIDLNDLREVIKNSKSKRKVLSHYEISNKNGNQAFKLDRIIKDNNIDVSHFYHYKDFNIIKDIIIDCVSYKDIGIKLGVASADKPMHSRYYTKIKKYIEKHDLDISHFNESGRYNNSTIRYNLKEIFSENSEVSKQTLKIRYIKYREENNIPTDKCDGIGCNISHWHGQQLSLQLDHINGVNNDNRIENLRLLCPNCHSLTSTFGGKRLKTMLL